MSRINISELPTRRAYYTGSKGNQYTDWVTVCDGAFEMDKLILSNVIDCHDANHDALDTVILITGLAGSGKSTLAGQIAAVFAWLEGKDFGPLTFVFSAKDFITRLSDGKMYEPCIYDESRRGLNIKRSMSQINQAVMSKLQEIRRDRKYIIVVTPRFKDLMEDIAVDRSVFLINCGYARKMVGDKAQVRRGAAYFYSFWNKDNLFFWRLKYSNHRLFVKFKSDFVFKFTEHMPGPLATSTENYDAYEKGKIEFLKSTKVDEKDWKKERLLWLIYNLRHSYDMAAAELAELAGVNLFWMHRMIAEANKAFKEPENRPKRITRTAYGGVEYDKSATESDTDGLKAPRETDSEDAE